MTVARQSSEHLPPIVSLRQTTWISPCQWEGLLEDGRAVYIRYKWGELSVRLAPPGSADFFGTEAWYDELVGNWKNPLIELEGVLRHTGLRLSPTIELEQFA